MLIQVPLVYKERPYRFGGCPMCLESGGILRTMTMDSAVIGHGPIEGPFTEVDGLEIKRDERFPVRATVQFYKATTSSRLTNEDVKEMRRQIDLVYTNADFVGSLVTEGQTGRPTDHTVPTKRWF
jgi:hypothetical protein